MGADGGYTSRRSKAARQRRIHGLPDQDGKMLCAGFVAAALSLTGCPQGGPPLERQVDCLKPIPKPVPGSLFGNLFETLDLLIVCSWVKWTELAPPSPVLAEFAIKPPPGRGPWPAVFPLEPVEVPGLDPVVEPPGAQGRYTTRVYNDGGGLLQEYDVQWQKIAADGGQVEVLGNCLSACTILIAYIPKERLCFGQNASLQFHMRHDGKGSPAIAPTIRMLGRYPRDIQNSINAHGGLAKMTIENFVVISASELWQMGYRKCDD
jgi:hypothetical protein